ncbi:cysteine hydrolase family protein [Roseivivax isoporae]|uniref:Cysteine hydrolase n=1 Tax=Roseivivax isoporae LMG 25204 TaxID=1449351 RepID=X7F7H9_9RHOB|nr:isochorismatase family cysteine hydrolase [Roseivivax isoporae]ETX28775.1 cysteine hydrolase [Roseivivax isoporae LMG 25204]
MAPDSFDPARTALLTIDLQNDFLHPDGAYGRAGQRAEAIAALPARIAPLRDAMRRAGCPYISAQFTLVPGPGGAPLIAPHLKALRPFLGAGDFAPGAFGHALVDDLSPADYTIEKVAYSAFFQTRLEFILRKLRIDVLVIGGIVTNGGVASTVRDAHLRDIDTILLGDGCAAFRQEVHDATLVSLGSLGTQMTCADMQVLAEGTS